MAKILFVCSGNTCRSPMAEALYNLEAAKRGLEPASSAGTDARDGMPAMENARLAVAEYGAELENHSSRLVTEEMLREADAVYCMTAYNRAILLMAYPEYSEKYHIMGENGIPDPYGGDIVTYSACAGMIWRALRGIIEENSRG